MTALIAPIIVLLFFYPKRRTALNISLLGAVSFALTGVMFGSIFFVPMILFFIMSVVCKESKRN
ncbi:hypothetical protein [Clostridium sp.]|uniref:hypothetical protein n=1 Tax=Clostridium sp. TaxID=1506 RepID=UPI003F4B192D